MKPDIFDGGDLGVAGRNTQAPNLGAAVAKDEKCEVTKSVKLVLSIRKPASQNGHQASADTV
ncbi:hypothetical protein [Roseovarius sp. D22-M7]|uniref:hypothetical protein n=1 Tax=Roseovarius sp. D22-M7 TaxID=3127116 RepID=UPI00301032BD